MIVSGGVLGLQSRFQMNFRYGVVFAIESFVLYLAAAQVPTWDQPAYVLKMLLAFAMGIQNGTFTRFRPVPLIGCCQLLSAALSCLIVVAVHVMCQVPPARGVVALAVPHM
jgi:hypothetical protein